MKNAIFNWIDERTGLVSGLRTCCDRKVAGGTSLCTMRIMPPMILGCVVLQAITGFFLWSYYSASSSTAWESVYYVQHEVMGGWLVRGIHHYSAQMLVFLLGLYVLLSVLKAAYRSKREFVYWIPLIMGLLALGSCLTGDLLKWTSAGYSATLVRTKFLLMLPVIGDDLFKLAIGGPGPVLDSHTLTRFLPLHVGIFGGGIIVLSVLWRMAEAKANDRELCTAKRTAWYWPDQAAINMVAMAAIVVLVLIMACWHHGAPLGAPADSANFDGTARPEWSFRALYELTHFFEGGLKFIPVFVLSTLMIGLFMVAPLIDAWVKFGKMTKMPVGQVFNVVAALAIAIGGAGLTWYSYHHDSTLEGYQADLAHSKLAAERAVVLAQRPEGIPREGALSLILDDPAVQGPILYKNYCASCHAFTDADGEGIASDTPKAPNLGTMASPEWVAGWLDAEKIAGPEYFGNTAFAEGDMVDFVKKDLPDYVEDLAGFYEEDAPEGSSKEQAKEFGKTQVDKNLRRLIDILAEESTLAGPREIVDDVPEGLEDDDLYLFEDFGCSQCHDFYSIEAAKKGACDLTAYCSRDWVIGIVSDPTQKEFYGSDNDGMPAMFKSAEDAQLSERQIEMLVDWMRNDWYMPEEAAETSHEE